MAETAPLILFGAFDRHNFGDLLIAHVAAAALAPRPVVFAGLAERDLTAWGGHRVRAIGNLAREWGDAPADVLHVGGEILTCSLYEAAVMLQPPERVPGLIARYDGDPTGRAAWARSELGLDQETAYLVPRTLFRRPRHFLYMASGGVDLANLPGPIREEVLAHLRQAAWLGVRDEVTLACLAGHGLAAHLAPDSGVRVAELFAAPIAERAMTGQPRAIGERFPQGYLAVQFSADFGDNNTLRALADQLDRLATDTGLGIVLFRAGAAPWHDDAGVYRRLAGFLGATGAALFESIDLWDICALLAHARAFCGSSLHGRIVAEAFGRPAVNLVRDPDTQHLSKQAAYAFTWAPQWQHSIAAVPELGVRVEAALALDGQASSRHAQALVARSRTEWDGVLSCLNGTAGTPPARPALARRDR